MTTPKRRLEALIQRILASWQASKAPDTTQGWRWDNEDAGSQIDDAGGYGEPYKDTHEDTRPDFVKRADEEDWNIG